MNQASIIILDRKSQENNLVSRGQLQELDGCIFRVTTCNFRHSAIFIATISAAFFTVALSTGIGNPANGSDAVIQDKQQDAIQQYRNQIFIAGLAIDGGKPEVGKEFLAETNPKLRGWEYGYLRGQSNRAGSDVQSKLTNEGYAEDVVFSPDGKFLIFGRGDDVIVWDFAIDKSMTLKGHQGSIASVAICPDGEKIATGGWDGKVFIWNAKSGEKVLEYRGHNLSNSRPGSHETQVVRDLCFSPDGLEIVSTAFVNSPFVQGVKPELKIWTVKTGGTRKTLMGDHNWGRSNAILCVAFSPDGKLVATGSFDHKIRIWDAGSGTKIRTIKGHSNNVLGVAFSPDGKQLASASTDRTLAIWDVADGEKVVRMRGHKSAVFSVQFSYSGKRIVSGGYDQTVKIWDAESGLELLTVPESGGKIRSVAISEDDQWIAASRSGTSRLPGVTLWKSEID